MSKDNALVRDGIQINVSCGIIKHRHNAQSSCKIMEQTLRVLGIVIQA